MAGVGGEGVFLRVYDISDGIATTWSPLLLGKKLEGVWHTGVEVYGKEYFYAGGIVKMNPKDVEITYGITPVKVHHLGATNLSKKDFESYLRSVKDNFTREKYDLVTWNCNNFSNVCAKYLLKRNIPAYILDLPSEVRQTFMGRLLVNFFKMLSEAPVDAPKAAVTESDEKRAKWKRRNSCPATPVGNSSGKPSFFSNDGGEALEKASNKTNSRTRRDSSLSRNKSKLRSRRGSAPDVNINGQISACFPQSHNPLGPSSSNDFVPTSPQTKPDVPSRRRRASVPGLALTHMKSMENRCSTAPSSRRASTPGVFCVESFNSFEVTQNPCSVTARPPLPSSEPQKGKDGRRVRSQYIPVKN